MGNKNDKIQNSEFEQKLRENSVPNEKPIDRNHRHDDAYDSTHEAKRDRELTESVPIIEERIKVDKKTVETGKVRIGKHIEEEDITLDVPTLHDEVDVERVEINEYVETAPPAVRHEGEKMIIPVLKEVSVVVKKLLLVEELHITKRQVETHKEQKVTLRKEVLDVVRVPSNDVRINSSDRTPDGTTDHTKTDKLR